MVLAGELSSPLHCSAVAIGSSTDPLVERMAQPIAAATPIATEAIAAAVLPIHMGLKIHFGLRASDRYDEVNRAGTVAHEKAAVEGSRSDPENNCARICNPSRVPWLIA
jgi:hypothetical protein